MFSRVTLLEIDTMRADVDDVLREFETRILPNVREMPGYEGIAVMVTLLEIDTLRVEVEDVLREFETRILPDVREMTGYEGIAVMVTPEGKGMVVSFWETEEDVEASAGLAASAVEEFVTVYRAPPGREHYRVAYAEMPRVTVES